MRHVFGLAVVVVLAGVSSGLRADDWPQWQGPKRDGVWREQGILEKFPAGGPNVLWRAPLGGGFTGPAVADGRVFVMDRQGDALGKGKEEPAKGGLRGKERILCLGAHDGKLLWKHEYDCAYRMYYPSGPRTTPLVQGGKVYTLGAMGDLFCLDATSGAALWHKNLVTAYKTTLPLWGYAAHPLIDGDKLICLVGGENSAVVAFHKDTGKELWKALTVSEIGYAPPLVIEAGKKRQLIVWHPEALNGLDVDTGKLYWSVKFPADEPVRPAITVATPRHSGDLLYVSSPHHGSLMVKLAADRPAAELLWRGKSNDLARPDGLHSMMGSPVLYDGHVYGVCNFGELRCLNAATGKRLWEHKTTERRAMSATTFLVAHSDRFFLFNDQGELIIARLSPKGYQEIERAAILAPTLHSRGRDVVWSHPAFANQCLYARNDQEIVCVSLKE